MRIDVFRARLEVASQLPLHVREAFASDEGALAQKNAGPSNNGFVGKHIRHIGRLATGVSSSVGPKSIRLEGVKVGSDNVPCGGLVEPWAAVCTDDAGQPGASPQHVLQDTL